MRDSMTLEEIIDKFREATPHLDDKAAEILRRYPEVVDDEQGGFNLGRIIGIATLDFLCWAYDAPEIGYVPPGGGDAGV